MISKYDQSIQSIQSIYALAKTKELLVTFSRNGISFHTNLSAVSTFVLNSISVIYLAKNSICILLLALIFERRKI